LKNKTITLVSVNYKRFLFAILIIAGIGLPQIASAAINRISGNGYIFPETTTYKATFSMDVSKDGANPPAGWAKYYYSRTRMNMVSTGIADFTTSDSGTTANLSGTCTINNIAGYTFTITAIDKVPDSFQIKIFKPDGSLRYSAGPKNLSGGNLTVIDTIPPTVTITSPLNLVTVGSSPINISGTVDDPTAIVTVNGIPAAISNGQFTVSNVTISEGMNTIVARAIDPSNNIATASVNISLDSTPPQIAISSPPDGYVAASSLITVTGIINDIVRGTVNESQGSVLVNGIEAVISNRNFIVESVPLSPGINTITAEGSDQWGNTASTSITVNFDTTPRAMINMVSGNNQSGPVGTLLSDPLVVSVTDKNDSPVAGATVVYRIIENNGSLTAGASVGQAVSVATDSTGMSQSMLTLGTWAGSGNNKIEVSATGVEGKVIFTESGEPKPPAAIYVAQGGQQRGAVSQTLPEPLVAYVTDEGHNPLENVSVIFKAVEGGGLFTNGLDTITVNSDSDGRATTAFILGPTAGNDANIVEATFSGNTRSPASFIFTGLIPGNPGDTKISGVVLDNSNNPIRDVTARVEGTTREAKTDTNGQFVITSVPVGPVHLIADGSTAGTTGILEYPTLMYELTTISGADNTVGMPIYLVPIDLTNAKLVGGNEDVTYTIPDVPGFSFTVKANSVTFPDGKKQGHISVTQVHADKVPMVPQIGQQPNFIVTIQPPGTVFDPPAPISIPNIDGLSPGEKTSLYSFDHDLGVFVSIGTGTVSEEGMIITSDPGVGVVKAGWHSGGNPNPTGNICRCATCQTCFNNACVAATGMPCQNDGDACTQDICDIGVCIHPAAPNGTSCSDDGNSCTDNVCSSGVCTHPTKPDGASCSDDGNSCTDNVCNSGVCTYPAKPDNTSCDDDNESCTDDLCSSGVCTHPAAPDGTFCDDEGNSCTDDRCSSGVCDHLPLSDGTTCDDDNESCTDDLCNGGTCIHPSRPDGTTCDDDSNKCTNDYCSSAICIHDDPTSNQPGVCCNPDTGNVTANRPIADLNACPNRVPNPDHVPSFNGCGPALCPGCIPENPNEISSPACALIGEAPSFTAACNPHDICYDTCGIPQETCDGQFLLDMASMCLQLQNPSCRDICMVNAYLYKSAVGGAGGVLAYEPAQKNACNCCK